MTVEVRPFHSSIYNKDFLLTKQDGNVSLCEVKNGIPDLENRITKRYDINDYTIERNTLRNNEHIRYSKVDTPHSGYDSGIRNFKVFDSGFEMKGITDGGKISEISETPKLIMDLKNNIGAMTLRFLKKYFHYVR